MSASIFSIKLPFLIILSLFLVLGLTQAQASGAGKPSIRMISSNSGSIAAAKSNSLLIKACPIPLFTFQSSNWQQNTYNYFNTYFTSFFVGRDFGGDIRICRYSPNIQNQESYVYGFEQQQQSACIGADDYANGTRIKYNNYYGYDVLYVPKSLNTAWVTQRNFPKFPNINPEPLGVRLSPSVTAYLARCKIVLDKSYDPSFVVRVPGIILSSSLSNSLTVRYNGVDFTCDQEDLEFAVCV